MSKDWLQHCPPALIDALARLARQRGVPFYIAGGAVRDWLLGQPANDLDITVAADGIGCARTLARDLGGSFVLLDREEDVARVVWRQMTIDFSGFREGAATIETDLQKRDFTINALAVPFDAERPGRFEVIDPTGGGRDIKAGLIRCTSPAVFDSDPLRLLRAYRFMAAWGFALEPATREAICRRVMLIGRVSAERLAYELELIMASGRAAAAFGAMAASGLLWRLFPELEAGLGMAQPASHHLDVFGHALAALGQMEKIQQHPAGYFPGHAEELGRYLTAGRHKVLLKWAALFHDLGKPLTWQMNAEKGDRITFYNHDRLGAEQFLEIVRRLKWSKADSKTVGRFIRLHMWPFHLNNARRKTNLTPRAYLRLVRAAGEELTGLFLLAMADTLAGQGPEKPAAGEEEVAELYELVWLFYLKSIKPVIEKPRLLTGHDLVKEFGLAPGPLFARILRGLENARVAGEIGSRLEALQWVRGFLARQGTEDRGQGTGDRGQGTRKDQGPVS